MRQPYATREGTRADGEMTRTARQRTGEGVVEYEKGRPFRLPKGGLVKEEAAI